jgi:hypothetical protein
VLWQPGPHPPAALATLMQASVVENRTATKNAFMNFFLRYARARDAQSFSQGARLPCLRSITGPRAAALDSPDFQDSQA